MLRELKELLDDQRSAAEKSEKEERRAARFLGFTQRSWDTLGVVEGESGSAAHRRCWGQRRAPRASRI